MKTAKKNNRIFARRTKHVEVPARAAYSYDVEYYDFDDLTPEQQKQAIELYRTPDYVYDCEEIEFDIYEENIAYRASEYENKYGLKINTDKLYWENSSHGPYAKWKLSDVIEPYSITGKHADYEIDFDGVYELSKYTVVYVYNADDDVEEELDGSNEFYLSEMSSYPIAFSADIKQQIMEVVNAVNEFLEEVWKRIKDVCSFYPDDEYVAEDIRANDIEFFFDDDGELQW